VTVTFELDLDSVKSKLSNSVLSNPHHVLYRLVLPVKDIGYNSCDNDLTALLSRQKTAT